MPIYEYYCPICRTRFEALRPMAQASNAAICPSGHKNAERVVSLVAARAWDGAGASMSGEGLGGGCACGGACSCGGR